MSDSEQTEWEHLAALGIFEPFPFRHGYAATLSPLAGTAFGTVLFSFHLHIPYDLHII